MKKYQKGNATEEEINCLLHWVQGFDTGNPKSFTVEELEVIKAEMWLYLAKDEVSIEKIRLWPRIIGVAAAVSAIIFGVWYYSPDLIATRKPQVVTQTDIAPGRTGATLTLASGKKIKLTDVVNGEIAKEAGVTISKTNSGQIVYEIKDSGNALNKINELSTARGETYQIRLPDGTSVILNAASSLRYPSSFSKIEKREVILSGEAYFEVAKNKQQPFIVKSKSQEIQVLGTHFNVTAYPEDRNIKTTLLEGSVRIVQRPLSGTKENTGQIYRVLTPGEQSVSTGDEISISDVDIDIAVAWKNNKFMFDSQPISEIMVMLARWYDVQVVYEGKVPKDNFSGTVSRYENISKVLSILERAGGVHFKIQDRKIYVSE